jgi:hypothetical protein
MSVTATIGNDAGVGAILRDWRQRRRLSQLDLSLETGRAKPSAEMVLHLAEQLDVPLRERNALLLAAGYAPRYGARSLDDPELAHVRDALGHVLQGHEPYPAIAVDRGWNLVASNSALGVLLDGVDDQLLVPPVNCMRLALHPDGIAPRILNLGEWRTHLLHRLERQFTLTGDKEILRLRQEVLGYPGPDHGPDVGHGNDVMVGFRIATAEGRELSFFSTVTTFGTAVDITVSELSIEAFFPADADTAAVLTRLAAVS